MAEAARRSGGADLGVGISGIAGPDGATPGKPVGTVWVAWASGDGTRAEHRLFAGDRDAVRRQSVALALCGLLAELDRRPA
jgi:nicotinamide-nucleotide amidase